jgi:hypothetical protein
MKTITNFLSRLVVSAVLAISLLAIGAKADAAETSIGVHTVSHHTHAEYFDHETRQMTRFNNSNPGLYIRASSGIINTSNITFGFYKNSVHKTTVYGTIGIGHNLNDRVNIGLQIGVGTGYNKSFGYEGSVVPVGGLTISTKFTDDLTGNVVFVPPVKSTAAGVFHFTLDHKF